ncbi:MAG: glycosyltransferase family 1 protein [Chitinophagaceae bacterium]
MQGKIKVVFFQRKPLPFHKSLEFIFDDVRKRLNGIIEPVKYVFSDYSKGLISRINIIKEANKNKGNVNHVTGDIHFATIGLPKATTLLTIHDCRMLSDSKGVKHLLLKYFWFTLPLKHCRYITVVSETTKREVLKYANYLEENIFVIPVAISESYSYQQKEFNCKRPSILQVGTTINKNITRLIEAIKDIDCTIRFIGKLTEEDAALLQKYKIDYAAEEGISHEQLVKAYEACDMVSFVSTYEGFGMPIVEGNAVGRPVITSNISSMPEIAADAAHLVDPFDISSIREGILLIKNSETYRNKLIANGLINCRRFDAAVIANQYLDVYKKIAAGE